MKMRELGRSGLSVSALGLGCMGIDFGYSHKLSKDEGIRTHPRSSGSRRDLFRHRRSLWAVH